MVRLKWPSVTLLAWQELVENKSFTTIRLRSRQNLKYEVLRSSFGRLRQKIAPKSVPHVQHDYFSTNQVIELLRCRFLNSLNTRLRRQVE